MLLTRPGAPGGGRHLFATHPILQIGPVGLLVALPFRLLGAVHGVQALQVALCLLGLGVLWVAERLAQAVSPDQPRRQLFSLVGGLCFAPSWCWVAVYYVHLDDALALAFIALAALLTARQQPWWWVGISLGLACASKPWAVIALPVVLALPRPRRLVAAGAAVVTAAICWAPFLTDVHTFSALGRFSIPVWSQSGLRILGVHAAQSPHWVRSLQFVGGAAASALAWKRGRGEAILLVAVAVRLAFDPGLLHYYDTGLVLGALLSDAGRTRAGVPWRTIGVFLTLTIDHSLGQPSGWPHFLLCLTVIGATIGWPGQGSSRSASSSPSALRRAPSPASTPAEPTILEPARSA